MKKPLVSIVIPTFNRAYCLPKTLQSVLDQTHKEIEALVVDDGSSDETGEIVRRLAKVDKRVKYVRKENGGVASARNMGMQLAQGEYIALLDSDDLWEPWKLQLQVACMERAPETGMCWTDMRAMNEKGEVFNKRYLRTMYSSFKWFTLDQLFSKSSPLEEIVPYLLPELQADNTPQQLQFRTGDIYSQMVTGSMVHTSTVMLRRSRMQEVGGFDEMFKPTGEDFDFHLRTCKAGAVGFIDIPTMTYMVGRPDQLTQSSSHLAIAKWFLFVVERELSQNRQNIHLPERLIKDVLAEAHEWIGYRHLLLYQTKEARLHLMESLKLKPLQPRTLRLLASAMLPENTFKTLHQSYHSRQHAAS